jgi:hypothetical protein
MRRDALRDDQWSRIQDPEALPMRHEERSMSETISLLVGKPPIGGLKVAAPKQLVRCSAFRH